MPLRIQQDSQKEKFRRNFKQITKPNTQDPKMPNKLSTLSSDQLSDIQNLYAAWREFLEDEISENLPGLLKAQEEYDYTYNIKFLEVSSTSKSIKVAEIKTNVDLEVRKKYLSLQEVQLYQDLLLKKLESYNNCLTVISREITRRSTNA